MDHSGPPRRTVEPPTGIKHSKGHPTAKRPQRPLSQPPASHTTHNDNEPKGWISLAITSRIKWLKEEHPTVYDSLCSPIYHYDIHSGKTILRTDLFNRLE